MKKTRWFIVKLATLAVLLAACTSDSSLRLAAGNEGGSVAATVEMDVQSPDALDAPPNVTIFNIDLLSPNTTAQTREVRFDINWPESWRGPQRPSYVEADNNWDAAWVFIKHRADGPWQHATLRTSGHSIPAGTTIDTPSDGMGAFIYRAEPGYGTFSAEDVGLMWDYGADGVANDAEIELRVFAIEMVYVPQGSFYVGSGGTEVAHFRDGMSNDPYQITAQDAISLGHDRGQLNWTTTTHSGTPVGRTNPDFPTGYDAFYAMKYQITQQQYVDFLTLTQEKADHRMHRGSANRYAITGDAVGEYTTTLPLVALNKLSWADGAAFADWAGLRPMTELEYEKAARGTQEPVPNEYAWGSTSITEATELDSKGTMHETLLPVSANANFGWNLTPEGPARVGNIAAPGKTREQAGASYYGLMEMSGNLWERAVTIGNADGRAFAGSHGDGTLDSQGNATLSDWPQTNARGTGMRGGDWFFRATDLRVSDRRDAANRVTNRDNRHGWRGVRSAP